MRANVSVESSPFHLHRFVSVTMATSDGQEIVRAFSLPAMSAVGIIAVSDADPLAAVRLAATASGPHQGELTVSSRPYEKPSDVADTTILSLAASTGAAGVLDVDQMRQALSSKLLSTLALLREADDEKVLATVKLMGLGSRLSLAAVGAISAARDTPGAPVVLRPMMRLLLDSLTPVRRSRAEVDAERAELETFIATGLGENLGPEPEDPPSRHQAHTGPPPALMTQTLAMPAKAHSYADGRHRRHSDGTPA